MQFWQHKTAAKTNTKLLLLLFTLAVILVSSWFGGLIKFIFGGDFIFWSTITLVAILLSSARRTIQLQQNGSVLAENIGATFIGEKPQNPNWLRFRNTSKEMAIASRIKPPKLYVLENEQAVNAFATGHTQKDAVIVVTAGMLDLLNRDELQGVIAHEMGHIVNGDIEINLRLMGLLHGMLIIGRLGEMIIDIGANTVKPTGLPDLTGFFGKNKGLKFINSANDNEIAEGGLNGGSLVLMAIGFGLLFLGFIGLAVGRLVKAAISRQRELLADASAVQFTRQTQSLANALKKMAALPAGCELYNHATAEEFSHMLIMPGQKILNLYATHPPILERIKLLDPSFNPTKLKFLQQKLAQK